MKRRRSRRTSEGDQSDGLELLLDTVANLFGGIMFIAMLIAIMTGEQTQAIAESEDAEAIYMALRLLGEQRSLDNRLQILESTRGDLASMVEVLRAETHDDALTIVQRLKAKIGIEHELLEEDRSKLETVARKASEVEAIESSVDEELERIKVTLRDLRSQIENAKATRSPEAKLPQRTMTDKRWANIVLRYGRLYVAFGPDDLEVAEDATYEWLGSKGSSEERVRLEFRPSGGIPVDDKLARHPRWNRLNAWFPPRDYIFSLTVYEDSYEAFLTLRRIMEVSGYRYQLIRSQVGNDYVLVTVPFAPTHVD